MLNHSPLCKIPNICLWEEALCIQSASKADSHVKTAWFVFKTWTLLHFYTSTLLYFYKDQGKGLHHNRNCRKTSSCAWSNTHICLKCFPDLVNMLCYLWRRNYCYFSCILAFEHHYHVSMKNIHIKGCDMIVKCHLSSEKSVFSTTKQ